MQKFGCNKISLINSIDEGYDKNWHQVAFEKRTYTLVVACRYQIPIINKPHQDEPRA